MSATDRLFPADPRTRDIARDLYSSIADLPIVAPHGHVDAALILDDRPFVDPVDLFVTHDHYITRLLHASGVDIHSLLHSGDRRSAWQALIDNWRIFEGTAAGYWLEQQLSELFEVDSGDMVDSFDIVARHLAQPEFLPRSVFARFDIDVLATTDHPLDDLSAHSALAADPTWGHRVLPSFRPDSLIDPRHPDFANDLARLVETTGRPLDDFAGYLRALEHRRAYFIDHGAVSADHGVVEPYTLDIDAAEASALFRSVVAGNASTAEKRDFAAHMLFQMARMSVTDGLVMTVHAGVVRNHSADAFARFGADSGHDIPRATEFTDNLRPLLQAFGLEKDFHLVLFTVDESTYSREIAPLAGFYPSVFIGAPWWFLDAPDAARRFREAVTETAGFTRGSGFIDDTRALLSIPVRHDMARRTDASFLARLVVEERLKPAAARRIAIDLVSDLPRRVFKL